MEINQEQSRAYFKMIATAQWKTCTDPHRQLEKMFNALLDEKYDWLIERRELDKRYHKINKCCEKHSISEEVLVSSYEMQIHRLTENLQLLLTSIGVEKIAEEREKQIEKYGFTAKHSRENPQFYDNYQLVWAAIQMFASDFEIVSLNTDTVPENWDKNGFNKMQNKEYSERLIIAGALIAAEIDRLNYVKEK